MSALSAPVGAFSFLLPGDWRTPTGGYRYDRRLAQALGAQGWAVQPCQVDGPWPWPDAATLARAAAQVSQLPDGTLVVADGLAFGALDEVLAAHAQRLRWLALVHHPLHLETGLDAVQRRTLLARETRALRHARQVVVTSARTARDVADMGVVPDRIAVVEPGTDALTQIDDDACVDQSRNIGLDTDIAIIAGSTTAPVNTTATLRPVRLLCVATLTPRKGHEGLLQALASLRDLPWQLHCVGSLTRDTPTAQRLQAQAAAAGLDGRVHWHGEVSAAALRAQYAAADLLVLASHHEGYGMVVAEALAAGLPVLATDAGALAQTLPASAGLCVPAGDGAALQAALRKLISQPALRAQLAAGARAAGRQLPDWPAQARRFAAVLAAMA